jgi:type II secretory ATPase GspE/PulE/Tfp pilus assembly ATPase PilB-like protein
VASSLNCILAQRLVKRICVKCKVPDDSFEQAEGFNKLKAAYKGAGCNYCRDTGYYGQTGVFEFLPITPMIKRLIAKSASEDEIWEEAKANGVKTLFEDAFEKVEQGITTVDEVMVKIPNLR